MLEALIRACSATDPAPALRHRQTGLPRPGPQHPLFAAFPKTKWVLFGDTGEQDPEVYQQMSVEKPGSIQAIFIHNVTKASPSEARFSCGSGKQMTVFTDWKSLSKDLDARGLGFGQTPK